MAVSLIKNNLIRAMITPIVISSFIMSLAIGYVVQAAPVVGFNPGYIISDNIFTNSQTMSPNQIQAFLLSKVPVCDTWGTGGTTPTSRADFIRSYGYDVPLKCLMDYVENGKTAAQIIYDTAQKYQINPQVLIVLLQKEQGLVTDDWPGPWQYKTATGYGCPDTAPCDSQYFGLTNQLDWSGRMFRAIMDKSPTWYTPYTLGNNFILYNPNSSCGGTNVNIQNQATQALYNYTPYQPNQAALNAGYNLGDSCSAYGNRNFFLYFSDWFGSPLYGNLVRTTTSSTVYLVSGENKYSIADINTLNSLSPLGGVSYVNQGYLDLKVSQGRLDRFIKSSTGDIYFFDSGIKLRFSNCEMVSDYGGDCDSTSLLTDYQISKLTTGPSMKSVYKTTSGKRFYIKQGEKKEIFDDLSLQDIGVSLNANILLESGISNLPYGVPVVRDNVIARSRVSDTAYLSSNGSMISIPKEFLGSIAFSGLPFNDLDSNSINKKAVVNDFNGFVQDSLSNKYLIDKQGKASIINFSDWSSTNIVLGDDFINAIPNSTQPINSLFIKSEDKSTLYYVHGQKKYPIASWDDFINLSIDKSTSWSKVYNATINSLTTGSVAYAPGSLIKSKDNATVYVVNGLFSKLPLPSFSFSDDYGLSGVRVVQNSSLDAYADSPTSANSFVLCNSKNYLANMGTLYEIDDPSVLTFGYGTITPVGWDEVGCSNLSLSTSTLSTYSFIKTENSKTIYYVENGVRRPITSILKYIELGGSSDKLLIVSQLVMGTIALGPNI